MTGPEKGSDPNIAVSRTAYSERLLARQPAQCQNSASKMMIGIGTPNNQSKIPRPIFVLHDQEQRTLFSAGSSKREPLLARSLGAIPPRKGHVIQSAFSTNYQGNATSL